MNGKEAGKVRVPWGKHKGKELDSVPCSYIDWLSGLSLKLYPELQEAIAAYIKNPWFNRELLSEKKPR